MTGDEMTTGEKLGRLLALTEVLSRDFQFIKDQIRADNASASASRTKIHERLDDYLERMVSLEKDVQAQSEVLDEVKAVTDEVTAWKAAGMGALGITGLAAGSISAAITSYWSEIKQLFTGHV